MSNREFKKTSFVKCFHIFITTQRSHLEDNENVVLNLQIEIPCSYEKIVMLAKEPGGNNTIMSAKQALALLLFFYYSLISRE